jgi:hypothetical protein
VESIIKPSVTTHANSNKELKGADYFLTVFSAVRRKNKK